MYLQIEEHEKTKMEWNKEKQNEDMKSERKRKTLPISHALDSYGAFFKFHEVKTFGKFQVSLLVKIDTKNLVPQN
jgi:hypothetical protein